MRMMPQKGMGTPGSRPQRRFSVIWLVRSIIGVIFVLQAITIAVLVAISSLRKRRKQVCGFPYPNLEEVQVGENALQVYGYGKDLYAAMLEAIDGARESIYLESFIWKDDEIGQKFKAHLAKKADEGVDVHVIFDSFGNLVVPRAFKTFPKNIHVLEYQSFYQFWHILDPRRYSLDHRKLLVIDGSIGFIGGFNIGSLYETTWRDTHLRIRGPAAADLAHSFIDFWNRFGASADEITQRYPRRFDPLINLRGNDALRLTFPIRDMYIEAIDRAEHTILLSNAYFVPDHVLLEALKAAAARGVDVRILVPWNSNHVIADWISHGYFSSCLQAGIRIFGYRHTMLHAKTCTIDDRWSTIGTANLDRLSSIGNYEINIEIYSPELAHQMRALFECDTADEIELAEEEWHRRSWYAKFSERILAPLRFMI
ncbi:phosphatidylserine/phosphatidylglycerophosphate/cardiolipin synthase family protein [Ktedonosporobacter rubrisoli]|uniref:Phosphatidylserine/phosphatidylglycerophosphate/ cardiolipin synthase family protein n=1 Tax=Ktedonosporobacter rubrisoli TaxID=2509675 RepID=A0A4V0Z0F5_KTERU|nr:phosphatidylserine/phosphatidylglycerophosphate/cardiolipin synthase family protein [Ktedonosporobacter rubrisoli]QBD83041.1 phosphatidylserine/phosphatidylglycerophosphate/cardiolipin synthase family protein [Ktedonosporobacter rubrisoli]